MQSSKKPNTCSPAQLSLTAFMIHWAKGPLMLEVSTGTWKNEAIKLSSTPQERNPFYLFMI
jgi:hypothetical protein